jgi:hypothetical protein
MARRLKDDIREILGSFPKWHVVQITIDCLPADALELRISALLDGYRQIREQRLSAETERKRVPPGLLITNLQRRLLSSIEAFSRTLSSVPRKALSLPLARRIPSRRSCPLFDQNQKRAKAERLTRLTAAEGDAKAKSPDPANPKTGDDPSEMF